MNKKTVLLALLALTLAPVCRAAALQTKVYRVGVLFIGAPLTPELNGLREGLGAAGYVEGKNLLLEISATKAYEELRPAAKAFVARKTDVIVTFGSTATNVAKKITREIPIVFLYGQDPVRQGFVKSMAHPGMNLTGMTIAPDFELQGKRLELFKEAVPALKRVAVLYNGRADAQHHAMSFATVRKVAPSLGLKLVERPVKSVAELELSLASVGRGSADGIFTICASMFRGFLGKIAAVAIKKQLPLMTCFAEGVAEDGGLLDYQTDRGRIAQRGAWYVDRILKGTKPADLPVETPMYFELVINLKTAKQIGLTIPPNLLARANRVIK
jgi:putative tryptophan/tyrosine transport system substrate-binding protein